jgi:hypothetical protein
MEIQPRFERWTFQVQVQNLNSVPAHPVNTIVNWLTSIKWTYISIYIAVTHFISYNLLYICEIFIVLWFYMSYNHKIIMKHLALPVLGS